MYYRPRIIPTLLIEDGFMVKTTKFQKPRYLGDIINAVKIFNGKGVDELCVLDISAAKKTRVPNFKLLADVASEAFMPLSYGGGVCDIDHVKQLFRNGFEKVIMNTSIVTAPELVKRAVEYAGSQSIVASIDVKKDFLGREYCYINGGILKIKKTAVEMARYAQALGVGEIILTSIDNEGKMDGYNIELVKKVADAVEIPVIANGGAGCLDDIRNVLDEGHADAAAAGSFFVYYGRNKAVLITAPSEEELVKNGIYREIV